MTHDAPPITLSKPSELPGSPMSSVIGWDQPCLVCGYNLKHLALRDSCPECGTTVNFAIRRTRMVYQPLPWIHRLRLGAMLALVGSLLLIALAVWFADEFIFWSFDLWMIPSWSEFVFPAIGLVGVLSQSCGMLALSWGAPPGCKRSSVAEHMTKTSSALVAIASLVALLLTVLFWYEDALAGGSVGTLSGGYLSGIVAIAWVLITLAFPFMFFAGIPQLRLLAGLIPSKRSVFQIRLTFWLMIGFIILFPALFFAQIILSEYVENAQWNAYNANPNAPYPDDPWYVNILPLAMLGFTVGCVLQGAWMFFRLRRDLSTVAAEAVKIRTDQDRVDAEP